MKTPQLPIWLAWFGVYDGRLRGLGPAPLTWEAAVRNLAGILATCGQTGEVAVLVAGPN